MREKIYPVFFLIVICSFFFACGSKNITKNPPSLPAKPVVASTATVTQANLPQTEKTTSVSAEEKKQEILEKSYRKHPFVPLIGALAYQKEAPSKEESQSPKTVGLNSLELKGIITDNLGFCGLFRNAETGMVYITQQGKLLDKRREFVKDIVVGKVEKEKVVLKKGTQSREFILQKEER